MGGRFDSPATFCAFYICKLRPIGDQEVAGSTLAGSVTFFRGDRLLHMTS